MIRRPPLRPALLLAAVAAVLSSCATFTDADLAARVGDAELGYGEFERRVQLVENVEPGAIDGELGRAVVANWVALELSRDAGLVDLYEAGPLDSGILCVWAVSVPDVATGDAAVEQLRTGTDWGDFVIETDPQIPLDGRQECVPTSVVAEIADQFTGMTAADRYRTITLPGPSFAVIRMQTVDELSGFELLRTVQNDDPELVEQIVAAAADADIYVDARLGSFDPTQFTVTPLG